MKHSFTDLVPCRTVHLSDAFDVFCLVDARDYDWATQWVWNFKWAKRWDQSIYARRNVGVTRDTLYLHRELLLHVGGVSEAYANMHMVDHVNGNTLDNRRANLRWATARENSKNRHKRHDIPSLESIMALCPTFDLNIPF